MKLYYITHMKTGTIEDVVVFIDDKDAVILNKYLLTIKQLLSKDQYDKEFK